MREIALDTETTGLEPRDGHRIVEIGCVEMVGRIRTGKHFHAYLNPECDMPPEAFRVHGLSTEFLMDKPLFSESAEGFLAFIGEDALVIHNAAFDMKFLNAELAKVGKEPLSMARVTDTMLLARAKFPGAPASLDALCRRFNIDLSSRTKHGALLDAELLAEMYLELTGGSQRTLELAANNTANVDVAAQQMREMLVPRTHAASEAEAEAHGAFLTKIKNPLWKQSS
jgi:DNA polymerase-3 subunit epsilon